MSEASELCRRHISRQHLEVLAQYMERYPTLALASARSRDGHIQSKRMWEKIARTLNRIEEGLTKNGRNWSRYWCDLKFKIRRKYMLLQKCMAEGNMPLVSLSPIEQRIVKILTDDDGNLLPSASMYHQMGNFRTHYGIKAGVKKRAIINKSDHEQTDTDSKIDDSGGNNDTTDNIELNDNSLLMPIDKQYEHEPDIKPNINVIKNCSTLQDPIQIMLPEEKKSLEDLRRDLLEFELKKQRDLFEMELQQKKEKHELEMSILMIKKEIMIKELKQL